MNSRLLAPLFALSLLSGCVTPVGPVEVTRFHAPDITALGKGSIAIEAAPGMDAASLELRSFEAAVAQQLQRIGYTTAVQGTGNQIAEVRLSRSRFQPQRSGSPVSVGLGGSTGSYGSGLGVGIGLNLSGPPPEMVETMLGVVIKDRRSSAVLWEGRASFSVRATSPLANGELGAAKVAEALFAGFPGHSGETVLVK